MSYDGSIRVGYSANCDNGAIRAWRWTDTGGLTYLSNRVDGGGDYCWAHCTSDDGDIVGGFCGESTVVRQPVVWLDGSTSHQEFIDIVDDLGGDVSNWETGEIQGISSDGTVLAGIVKVGGVDGIFMVQTE